MYSRLIKPPLDKSFFLFGARGTGKSSWMRSLFKNSLYIDLLESTVFNDLIASPQRLDNLIPPDHAEWIIIDEVQKIPAILDEVHRLIEKKKLKFILSGSSARKLRSGKANLLAGRALTKFLYPLTSVELGKDFDLKHSLKFGCLPSVYMEKDPKSYLESYVRTYLEEEVRQEGLTRNIGAFARFLEAASFSQGSLLSVSEVAREAGVNRKVVEGYFDILEDILFAYRLTPFTKKAKRKMVQHPKFYFFDVGVYRTIRPLGPLDQASDIDGIALESLFLQEILGLNEYYNLGYKIHFWRSATKQEVDFVLYGEKNFLGIEVTKASKIRSKDLVGMNLFLKDYPQARGKLFYGGEKRKFEGKIEIVPIREFFKDSLKWIT